MDEDMGWYKNFSCHVKKINILTSAAQRHLVALP